MATGEIIRFNVKPEGWIELQQQEGCFALVDESITTLRPDDDCVLTFIGWDHNQVRNLDYDSSPAMIAGFSLRLAWEEVNFDLREMIIYAGTLEEIGQALKHVQFGTWFKEDDEGFKEG